MRTQEEWNDIWKQIIFDYTNQKINDMYSVMIEKNGNYRLTYYKNANDGGFGIIYVKPETVEIYLRKEKIEHLKSKIMK